MTSRKFEPLTYDDVEVGDTWKSPGRTITEADVVNFACMTGDFNPLHIDHEYAKNTPFGKPIAHGLLGVALSAGLAGQSPWMRTVAFIRIVDWTFREPIYIGDTLHIRTELVSKVLQGRGRRGLILWKRQLLNQEGKVVQEGSTETLVQTARTVKRESGERTKPE